MQDAAGYMIDLSRQSRQQRVAIAKRLLVTSDADAVSASTLFSATPASHDRQAFGLLSTAHSG